MYYPGRGEPCRQDEAEAWHVEYFGTAEILLTFHKAWVLYIHVRGLQGLIG